MDKKRLNRLIRKAQFLTSLKLRWFRKKWRKHNSHNETEARNAFHLESVSVGKGTYGKLDVRHFGSDEEKLIIGNYCSIGPDCVFILGGEHNYRLISTYPFENMFLDKVESFSKGPVVIEDDVWIGYGVKILSGTHLGQGAVIAAGSVVSGNIPPYAIAGGAPAKVIKYRFPESVRNELLKLDYSMLDKGKYMEFRDIFQTEINQENAGELLGKLNGLRK